MDTQVASATEGLEALEMETPLLSEHDLQTQDVLRTLGTNSTEDEHGDDHVPPVFPDNVDAVAEAPVLPVSSTALNQEAATHNTAESGTATTYQQMPAAQVTTHALIPLSLPIDALHGVASFLSPADWSNFGQSSRAANRICREIFRRVRMHGFRCATEVVTAWKLGEHADSRELMALYIKAGVPIYPRCLGHSYHTLTWRMGIEAREMQNDEPTSDEQPPQDVQAPRNNNESLDRFYSERYETRTPALTYLEEKCLYWYTRDSVNSASSTSGLARQLSLTTRVNFAPPPLVLPANDAGDGARMDVPLPGFRPGARNLGELLPPRGTLGLSVSSSYPELETAARVPKLTIKAHRHLVDQHILNSSSVDDENGAMKTPPISLCADFFHPHFPLPVVQPPAASAPSGGSGSSKTEPAATTAGSGSPDDPVVSDEMWLFPPGGSPPAASDSSDDEQATGQEGRASPPPMEQFPDASLETPQASSNDAGGESQEGEGAETNSNELQYETPVQAQVQDQRPPSPPPPPLRSNQDELLETPPPLSRPQPSILTNVDLQIYTSASHGPVDELKAHLRKRFEAYERQLDSMLVNLDSRGFEECLLDFWDEFLPLTAGIHYFDRYTAVPRLSKLHKFLTQPCPKAIGVVQCEIERIRSSSKKGVNMKGRLFPTYEYRLFIRDRRHSPADDSSTDETDGPPRRDTVLMTAKNRGKKHMDFSGVIPAPGSSRKGVNNYYLHMPLQTDVDAHYRAVNAEKNVSTRRPNGAYDTSPPPPADTPAPGLLGRLQSNFIGTEFEIFSPAVRKTSLRKSTVRASSMASCESENELDYDSGFSSDNPSTSSSNRRRRRFSRRTSKGGRRKNESADEHPDPIDEEVPRRFSTADRRKSFKRSGSWPVISYGRTSRTSRRAIAQDVEDSPDSQQFQTVLCEEEEGAITYTANLLGNRPRIMDVCIPKVSVDGVAAAEWKRYLNSCDDADSVSGNRMLQRFKQVHQRLENPDANSTTQDDEDELEGDSDYRPPDDFGLLALQNRPPWWNVELGAFVLNFGGRVNVASVKNFQLCDRSNQDYIMLQFGRIDGRHSFTMDFQHPLTAVQAFAIAISSLQSKISFG